MFLIIINKKDLTPQKREFAPNTIQRPLYLIRVSNRLSIVHPSRNKIKNYENDANTSVFSIEHLELHISMIYMILLIFSSRETAQLAVNRKRS